MSRVEDLSTSKLDAETKQLEDDVRQLVLMKETGPKSAAWHRARVQTIWRLQRQLAHARQTASASIQSLPDHDDQI